MGYSWGNLTNVYKHLKGGHREDGARHLGTFQSCPLKRQRAQTGTQEVLSEQQKTFFFFYCVSDWGLSQVAQRSCGPEQVAQGGPAWAGIGPDGPRDPCQPQPWTGQKVFVVVCQYRSLSFCLFFYRPLLIVPLSSLDVFSHLWWSVRHF